MHFLKFLQGSKWAITICPFFNGIDFIVIPSYTEFLWIIKWTKPHQHNLKVFVLLQIIEIPFLVLCVEDMACPKL